MKLSECYSIPDHVWADIQRYDRRIELKWNGKTQLVDVSRFGQHILSFPPYEENYRKLLYTLYHTDIWRRGGFREDNSEEVLRQIEAEGDAVAERTQRYWADRRQEEARRAWDYMNRVRTVPEKFAHTAPRGGMSIND